MNKESYFQRIQEQTPTRFWINNVTKKEAYMALDAGAVGCTQNPSYVWKMMQDPEESSYIKEIMPAIINDETDVNDVLIKIQKILVAKIAEIFLPLYKKSHGKYGFVSIQGDPFREDTETIIKLARDNCAPGPNIMAKIPVTKEGLEAISILAKERIPINATEVMAVKQAIEVCEVYVKATNDIYDPAPIYFSHIAGIFDEYLLKYVEEHRITIAPDVVWQAGISVAKKIYGMVKEKNYPVGFISGGARGLHHFTEMVGSDTCITINWEGTAEELIKIDPPVVQRFLQPTQFSVIDELVGKLDDFRKGYFTNMITEDEYEEFGPVVIFIKNFENAWVAALANIEKFRNS